MQQKAVIAGAGPAGLACARAIHESNPGIEIILIEAGRPYGRRPCPVDKGFACTGCGGVCNVVSGFGGSMHYGDGAKMSLLPSGRRLIDHFGHDYASDLCATAYGWLTQPMTPTPDLLGQNLTVNAQTAFAKNGLSIREYPVAVIGESALRQTIESWHARLDSTIRIHHSTEVIAAEPHNGRIRLTLRTNHTDSTLIADHLVLATGRRGVASTANLLHRLGIPMQDPDISVGVRFEMSAPLLRAIGEEHPDLKISQLGHVEHKVKTFCFCGGPNGGRVKFTHYQDAFGAPIVTLDGHETTERPTPTGRELASNFGLLCQVEDRGTAVQARESFLTAYRDLNQGRPFVQSLRTFLSRDDEPSTWSELSARMPFQPSINDLTTGRVDQLFTTAEHASLAAGFVRVMESILLHSSAGMSVNDIADTTLVIAPELEFLWERPALDTGCRVPGLPIHVVGDAAGIAQGIVQAAMMGIAAGQHIATGGGTR